jgi:hypothetical protein
MRGVLYQVTMHPRKYYAIWLHHLIIVIWEISKWCSEILSTKIIFAPLLAFSINKFCCWNWRIIKKQHGVVLSQVTIHPKNYYAILLCSCCNHLKHELMFRYIIDTSHISILDDLFVNKFCSWIYRMTKKQHQEVLSQETILRVQ